MSLKLHFNPFSSNSFKCLAVAHETGLPVELVVVELAKRAHKSPEFLAINPCGKVPALEHDDYNLWESNAICCYLAALAPEKNLLPLDAKGIGSVQQWLQFQATTLGPSTGKVMWETFYAKAFGRTPNEENLKKGYEDTARDLGILETCLADGREYLCGRLTVADFSIASNLLLRKKIGIDTAAFPKVEAYLQRMEARESVKRSLPAL